MLRVAAQNLQPEIAEQEGPVGGKADELDQDQDR